MNIEIPTQIRDRLLISSYASAESTIEFAPAAEVELVKIEGWRLRFTPERGEFAGQSISRVFVVPGGLLGLAQRNCRRRYGTKTRIVAGRALHTDGQFGDWNE